MTQAAEIPEIGEQRGQLISREVNNAVHVAFDALAQTVLVNNSRTLEDLVRGMLQPILKIWLDDNLPGIVERLLRVEIERISPRSRMASPHSN
jgi:cell pole-organizing protein PopZ